MSEKEDLMSFDGVVSEVLPNAQYRVRLDHNAEMVILAHASGRMRRNKIRILEGDRVSVEMTPYDLERGRITFRYK